jgi:hypothetical protein
LLHVNDDAMLLSANDIENASTSPGRIPDFVLLVLKGVAVNLPPNGRQSEKTGELSHSGPKVLLLVAKISSDALGSLECEPRQ